MESSKDPARLFVAYSHRDQEWLDRVLTMLQPFVDASTLTIWSDEAIRPGDLWRREIDDAIASSSVAVLFVSSDFLASDFVRDHELPTVLAAARSGRLTVLWIAVRPSMYEDTPLTTYQGLNDPSRPLSTLDGLELESEVLRVCKNIKQALRREEKGTAAPIALSTTEQADSRRPIDSDTVARMTLSVIEGLTASPDLLKSKTTGGTISQALEALEVARVKQETAIAKANDDTKKVLESGLPIESILMLFVAHNASRAEARMAYDLRVAKTIEVIEGAGGTPEDYSLPPRDVADARLQLAMKQWSTSMQSLSAVMKQVQSMILAPIRKIREGG